MPATRGGDLEKCSWNEMKLVLKSRKLKRLLGLKVHHNGFNSLEWRSAVASAR